MVFIFEKEANYSVIQYCNFFHIVEGDFSPFSTHFCLQSTCLCMCNGIFVESRPSYENRVMIFRREGKKKRRRRRVPTANERRRRRKNKKLLSASFSLISPLFLSQP